MGLYKIMIVDDEVEVREGIVNKIDWNTLGFDIVAQAENGEDALEKAESLDLDVVLTDIKMPFMDGLTLGARLHDLYPGIKLILFSGFDKFEYAKEAIKLDVVEYVLKPVNAQELTEVLRRVRQTLDEELSQKRDSDRLRSAFQSNLPVMRENYLNELLHGSLTREDVSHGIHFYHTNILPDIPKTVCVFDAAQLSPANKTVERELIPVSVKSIVDNNFGTVCSFESFIRAQQVVVIASWTHDPIRETMRIADSVCTECRRVLSLNVTAGVGRAYTDTANLNLSYEQAQRALEYKNIAGSGRAIYIKDMELIDQEPYTSLDSRIEQSILSSVKFDTPQQLTGTVDGIVRRMTDTELPLWQRQAFASSVAAAITHICQMQGIYDASMLASEHILSVLESDNAAELLTHSLSDVFSRLSENLNKSRMTAARNLVESAKAYIAESYMNSDLSVEMLCEHLHISQSYFSTIFKQETGQSYVAYLTDVRLSKAVELLKESDDKTYVVAKKVGYDDPNYFSYVFKKKLGVSPSSFRQGN